MSEIISTSKPGSTGRSSNAWTTSTSLHDIASALRAAKSVVILTHAKPDGDAIGSCVSVARALSIAGVESEVWLVGPIPRWTSLMCAGVKTRELAPGAPLPDALKHHQTDAYVVVDTGSWSQIADLRPVIEGKSANVLLIDHHLSGEPAVADRRFIDSHSASCTQVLAPLCAMLAGASTISQLPLPIAEALYLGLATDTGWLRYSSVTPQTLRLAGDLLEAGVDHTKLYALIEQQDFAGRWKLLGCALRSLTLHSVSGTDDIAIMRLSREDFASTGADRNDTAGFADMVLTIASVQVSALLIAHDPGADGKPLTKISMRSKPGDHAVDVNQVAGLLSGGGHARAAGAKANLDLDATAQSLLEAFRTTARSAASSTDTSSGRRT